MLLPEILAHAADKVIDLWEMLNLYAIRDISRRIVDAMGHMTATAEWQEYKMRQAGMARDDIKKAIQKLNKLSDEEVKNLFEEMTVKSHNADADIFKEAGIKSVPFGTRQAQKSLQVYYEQTKGELHNFTQTTADEAQSIYINACDGALLAADSGLESYSTAIRKAIDDAARGGLYVYYPSGHRDTVETAVRRAVMTGINRASLQLTIDDCKRFGTNYVIVSSHLGARVSDTNPIANHAGWQGGIYRISDDAEGFSGGLSEYEDKIDGHSYPLLRDATGYPDDPLGLGGYNCRHSMFPYVPGVSENHMQQFDPKKNREAFESQQKQRAMERRMRATKRRIVGMQEAVKEAKDPELKNILEEKRIQLSDMFDSQRKAYDAFCSENKLTPQMERTYTAGDSTRRYPSGSRKNKGTSGEKKKGIPKKKNIVYNTAGKPVKIVKHTDATGSPNSITEEHLGKGGINRNFYDENGRWVKQLSNHDHGHKAESQFGTHGQHAHDHTYDSNGNMIRGKARPWTEQEKKTPIYMTEARETFNEWAKHTHTLLEFTYKGHNGNIDPIGGPGKENIDYHLYYNAYGDYDERNEKDVHSFDAMMSEPFFDGKPLKDIIDDLEDVEY